MSNGHAPRQRNPSGEGDWLVDERDERRGAHENGHQRDSKDTSPSDQAEEDDRMTKPFMLGEDLDDHDDPDPDPDESVSPSVRPLPSDAIDLVKEDPEAVEKDQVQAQRRGEPSFRQPVHVYLHDPKYVNGHGEQVEEVYSSALPQEQRLLETSTQRGVPGGDPIAQLERIEERVTGTTPAVDKCRRGMTNRDDDEDNPWA